MKIPEVKNITLEYAVLNPPSHMEIDLQKARRRENLAAIGTFAALLAIDAAFVPGLIRNAITPNHLGIAFLSNYGAVIAGMGLQARYAFNTDKWREAIWRVESLREKHGIIDLPTSCY